MTKDKVSFTPGPWTIEFDETGGYDSMYSGWRIRAAQHDIVTLDCDDYGQESCEWKEPFEGQDEAAATARLIAAAPELYEALKEAEELYTTYGLLAQSSECGKWINKTRAALAKVEGSHD